MQYYPLKNKKNIFQVKLSLLLPGTHVYAHSGPTNCRLRAHLGLSVPKTGAKMRILDEIITWEEGKVIIIDDSFEHEVWHEGGDKPRLILIVDVQHPDLTEFEKTFFSSVCARAHPEIEEQVEALL